MVLECIPDHEFGGGTAVGSAAASVFCCGFLTQAAIHMSLVGPPIALIVPHLS
jgi:hypothetical protein